MGRHELWVELADRPGNLAAVAADLASCGANILHLDVHAGSESTVVDRLVVQVPDERGHELAAAAPGAGPRCCTSTTPTPTRWSTTWSGRSTPRSRWWRAPGRTPPWRPSAG